MCLTCQLCQTKRRARSHKHTLANKPDMHQQAAPCSQTAACLSPLPAPSPYRLKTQKPGHVHINTHLQTNLTCTNKLPHFFGPQRAYRRFRRPLPTDPEPEKEFTSRVSCAGEMSGSRGKRPTTASRYMSDAHAKSMKMRASMTGEEIEGGASYLVLSQHVRRTH